MQNVKIEKQTFDTFKSFEDLEKAVKRFILDPNSIIKTISWNGQSIDPHNWDELYKQWEGKQFIILEVSTSSYIEVDVIANVSKTTDPAAQMAICDLLKSLNVPVPKTLQLVDQDAYISRFFWPDDKTPDDKTPEGVVLQYRTCQESKILLPFTPRKIRNAEGVYYLRERKGNNIQIADSAVLKNKPRIRAILVPIVPPFYSMTKIVTEEATYTQLFRLLRKEHVAVMTLTDGRRFLFSVDILMYMYAGSFQQTSSSNLTRYFAISAEALGWMKFLVKGEKKHPLTALYYIYLCYLCWQKTCISNLIMNGFEPPTDIDARVERVEYAQAWIRDHVLKNFYQSYPILPDPADIKARELFAIHETLKKMNLLMVEMTYDSGPHFYFYIGTFNTDWYILQNSSKESDMIKMISGNDIEKLRDTFLLTKLKLWFPILELDNRGIYAQLYLKDVWPVSLWYEPLSRTIYLRLEQTNYPLLRSTTVKKPDAPPPALLQHPERLSTLEKDIVELSILIKKEEKERTSVEDEIRKDIAEMNKQLSNFKFDFSSITIKLNEMWGFYQDASRAATQQADQLIQTTTSRPVLETVQKVKKEMNQTILVLKEKDKEVESSVAVSKQNNEEAVHVGILNLADKMLVAKRAFVDECFSVLKFFSANVSFTSFITGFAFMEQCSSIATFMLAIIDAVSKIATKGSISLSSIQELEDMVDEEDAIQFNYLVSASTTAGLDTVRFTFGKISGMVTSATWPVQQAGTYVFEHVKNDGVLISIGEQWISFQTRPSRQSVENVQPVTEGSVTSLSKLWSLIEKIFPIFYSAFTASLYFLQTVKTVTQNRIIPNIRLPSTNVFSNMLSNTQHRTEVPPQQFTDFSTPQQYHNSSTEQSSDVDKITPPYSSTTNPTVTTQPTTNPSSTIYRSPSYYAELPNLFANGVFEQTK